MFMGRTLPVMVQWDRRQKEMSAGEPYTGGEEETTENSILIAVTAPHPESLTASQRGQTRDVSAFNPAH